MAASVKTIDAVSDGDLIITDIGKYAEILKRNAQGKWVSIYGMWSANEPAPVHK